MTGPKVEEHGVEDAENDKAPLEAVDLYVSAGLTTRRTMTSLPFAVNW